jgi:tetratricopeptide (TPR) repeat protein
MRQYTFLIPIAFVFALMLSCNTGKNALQRGDYYEATLQAVRHLRSSPDSKKARATLEKSYPMALGYYRQKIDQTALSGSPDKYLSIVESYTKLNNLADEITRCPAALEVAKPVVYFHEQLRKAQDLAVSEQYNEGIRLLASSYIEDARAAYQKFEWISKNRPGYADVIRKMAEAEDKGTLKIVVEKIPYMGDIYQANVNRFYDRIYADLVKTGQKKFIRYYQPKEAEEYKIVPHHVVKMQFADFSVGNVYEKETVKDYVSDTLVIGSFIDDKGVSHNVKGVVKAKASLHERYVISRGILDVKILDYQSGSILENKRYPGEYVWRNDWASFNGDERALPDNVKKMTREKQVMPPPHQDLFILFSDPLGSNASALIKSFYRNR